MSGDLTRTELLIELMRSGDSRAKSELLRHTCDKLHKKASAMLDRFGWLREFVDSADIAQEALSRLCTALDAVQPESALHFYRLAALQIRRELLELARQYAPRELVRTTEENLDSRRAPDEGPSSLAEWADFHEQVGQLPEDEREVFSLLWYGGLRQAEVASALGVSLRTVKRRWLRARCLLYDRMSGQPPD
jgi:RNA polymerase sigma-70 factor (ECF subfamily)